MTIFAVTYRYTDDVTTRDDNRTQHRDYLRGLAVQGRLLVSGPYGPDDDAGALLLFSAESRSQVEALIRDDPFTVHGVIAETGTAEWEPVIGPLLPALRDTQAGAPKPATALPAPSTAVAHRQVQP